MRTVVSPLRRLVQSRPTSSIPHPRQSLGRRFCLSPSSGPSNHARPTRPYSAAASLPAIAELTSLRDNVPGTSDETKTPSRPKLVLPRPKLYKKWHWLSLDEERLLIESDFENAEQNSSQLLVDMPENVNDFGLWLCILDYRQQRDGISGVAAVMEGLMSKMSLLRSEGQVAEAFWSTILRVATRDQDLLENVLAYALWLDDNHGVRLPDLYFTVVSSFIRDRRFHDAVSWHLGLGPRFGLDINDFKRLLNEFLTYRDRPTRQCLKALYLTSHHRRLYDYIIPYLYENGCSQVAARSWRPLLIAHGDLPRSTASRSLLRFALAYYRGTSLVEEERYAAGLSDPMTTTTTSDLPLEVAKTRSSTSINLREMVNRTHGHTFGIKEKKYNDEYGAKYFASSWVSIDFAIGSLYTLGISSIGPLTLQSIALREASNAGRITLRLKQLDEAGVGIGDSNYARALRHAAMSGHQDLVSELVNTDIHPDVFDDVSLEQDALISASTTCSWSQYRLIVDVRLAAATSVIAIVSNELFRLCLAIGNHDVALRLLGDMTHAGIALTELTVASISSHIPEEGTSCDLAQDISFYACLCSLMFDLRTPPSTATVRTILLLLCRAGRYDEFSRLAVEIIEFYRGQYRNTKNEALRVHMLDVPLVARNDCGPAGFQELPCDLSLRNQLHPIRLIFNSSVQDELIRQAFDSERRSSASGGEGRTLHFTDGIRVLALLRKRGVKVNVRQLRKNVVSALAEFRGSLRFIPEDLGRRLGYDTARNWNREIFEDLCDGAWGKQLLLHHTSQERKVLPLHKEFTQSRAPRFSQTKASELQTVTGIIASQESETSVDTRTNKAYEW